MNAGYQTVKARILVAVLSVLMVFGNVASPLAGAFNVYAAEGYKVTKGKGFDDMMANGERAYCLSKNSTSGNYTANKANLSEDVSKLYGFDNALVVEKNKEEIAHVAWLASGKNYKALLKDAQDYQTGNNPRKTNLIHEGTDTREFDDDDMREVIAYVIWHYTNDVSRDAYQRKFGITADIETKAYAYDKIMSMIENGENTPPTGSYPVVYYGDHAGEQPVVVPEFPDKEYVETTVNKKWIAADDNDLGWPSGASAEVTVKYGSNEKTVTLNENNKSASFKYEKISNAAFEVTEKKVSGYEQGEIVKNSDGTFTITNKKEPEKKPIITSTSASVKDGVITDEVYFENVPADYKIKVSLWKYNESSGKWDWFSKDESPVKDIVEEAGATSPHTFTFAKVTESGKYAVQSEIQTPDRKTILYVHNEKKDDPNETVVIEPKTDTPDEGSFVIVNKVDENNEPVPGAIMRVTDALGTTIKAKYYDESGKLIGTDSFKSNGGKIIGKTDSKLAPGKYYVVEDKEPEGYKKEGDGKKEFTITSGTQVGPVPGTNTKIVGTATGDGIIYGNTSAELADGSGIAFCITPQAENPHDFTGKQYAYSVISESAANLNTLSVKTSRKYDKGVFRKNLSSDANLSPEKMEKVKKVLWATYDYMMTGDSSKDTTSIISDNLGTPKFSKVGVYRAVEVAIAEIIMPGSTTLDGKGAASTLVSNDPVWYGNVKTLALALVAAADGQNNYFATYSGYSIVYLQTTDSTMQNMITPGGSVPEVTVTNKSNDKEYVETTVDKSWINANGNAIGWPEGQTVNITVKYGDKEKKATLSESNPSESFKFEKVKDAYFIIEEEHIDGYNAFIYPKEAGNEAAGYTIVNQEERPSSETTPGRAYLTIKAKKTLEGADINDSNYYSAFEFELSGGNLNNPIKVNNQGSDIIFKGIEFKEGGVYDFKISEIASTADGIIYSKEAKTIRVVVNEKQYGDKKYLEIGEITGSEDIDVRREYKNDFPAIEDAPTYVTGERRYNYGSYEGYGSNFVTIANGKEHIAFCLDKNKTVPDKYYKVDYNAYTSTSLPSSISSKKTTLERIAYYGYLDGSGEMLKEAENLIRTHGLGRYLNAKMLLQYATNNAIWMQTSNWNGGSNYTDSFSKAVYSLTTKINEKLNTPIPDHVKIVTTVYKPSSNIYSYYSSDYFQNLIIFDIVQKDHSAEVEFKTSFINYKPSIGTTVKVNGVSASNDAPATLAAEKAGQKIDVTDTISYNNLRPNTDYVVTGTLNEVNGSTVTPVANGTKTQTFSTNSSGRGTWAMTFKDVVLEAGKKYVVYEKAVNKNDPKEEVKHEDPTDKAQTVVVNEEPKVEKYVNNKVHDEIEFFDKEFEYEVLAYVPEGARRAVITDTLVDDLEFYNGTGDAKITILGDLDDNDHKVGSYVSNTGNEFGNNKPTINISGQTITVSLAYGTGINQVQGKWVKLTFKANIKKDSYGELLKKLKGETSTISWSELDDNKQGDGDKTTPNWPVLNGAAKHEGIQNNANFKVSFKNSGDYENDLDTNTVTVKPETVQVEAEKKWINADVDNSTTWPSGISQVKVDVMKGSEKVGEITLTKNAPKAKSDKLPKLQNVTYTLKEVDITGYTSVVTGDAETGFTVTNTEDNGTPTVEKYVNNKVHDEIEFFDKDFEYEVLAYVPKGAKRAVIEDELISDLEFAGDNGEGDAKVVIMTGASDHKVESSVKTGGTKEFGTQPGIEVDKTNGKITVTIESGKGIRYVQGMWVKLTYKAKIKKDSYNELLKKLKGETSTIGWSETSDEKQGENVGEKITANWPVVDGDGTHEGLDNTANYKVSFENSGNSWTEMETNTVTVKPETTKLKVEKTWANIGDKEWPDDSTTVTFGIYKQKKGQKDEKVQEVTLDKDNTSKVVEGLPKLIGVTYTAREIAVNGESIDYNDYVVNGTAIAGIIGEGTQYIVKLIEAALGTDYAAVKAINSKPEIEKYVNKDVHADLEGFDTEFTYDIMAYVPAGAVKVEIMDELKPQLELISSKTDIEGTVVAKATNDHTVSGTVSKGGDPVTASAEIDGNSVVVTVDNIKDQTLEGKWVQATLKAKISKAAYDAVAEQLAKDNWKDANGTINWARITKNDPVQGGSDDHSGLVNKAEYRIFVDNEHSSKWLPSNDVTVKPELEDLTITKVWEGDRADDRPSIEAFKKLLTVQTVKGTEVKDVNPQPAAEVTDNGDNTWTAKWTNLPKLENTKYQVKEAALSGYSTAKNTAEKNGIITNKRTPNEKAITVKKVWDGAKDSEKTAIKVQLFKTYNNKTEKVEGQEITLDGVVDEKETTAWEYTWNNLPDREGTYDVTYSVDEVSVPEGFKKTVSSEGTVFTITNAKGEIEKYVNEQMNLNDGKRDETVHTDLSAFDKVFTYDIQAYITKDATFASVTDELNKVLEFTDEAPVRVAVKDGASDGSAPKLTDTKGLIVLTDEDYNLNKTVWKTGKLVLTLGDEKGTEAIKNTQGQDLTGKWLQITFNAKIKDQYRDIDELEKMGVSVWRKVEKAENTPVDAPDDNSGELVTDHTGLINDTTYRIVRAGADIDNKFEYEDKSNTVTVKPKTTEVEVSKEWLLDGNKQAWPENAKVEVVLMSKNGDAEAKEEKTATLDSEHQSYKFEKLPVLEGVEYFVKEGKVTNGDKYTFGEAEKQADGSYKITNKKYTPEIEKYVNKKYDDLSEKDRDETVHTDLSAFDEVYTYDIQAYITPDAKNVVVTDELKNVLEFVGTKPVAVSVKNGEGSDGKTAPALTEVGTPLTEGEDYSVDADAWNKGQLILTMGSEAEDAEVLAEAGKWLQITFDAKIQDKFRSIDALKKEGIWVEVTENKPIDNPDVSPDGFSGATGSKHEGVVNDASYTINKVKALLTNDWQYKDSSNKVTVRPDMMKIYAKKVYVTKDLDEVWPVIVKIESKDGTVNSEIRLTKDKPSGASEDLPVLKDGYIVNEQTLPAGFSVNVTGNGTGKEPYVFTNTENEGKPVKVIFETSKTMSNGAELGTYTFELYDEQPGAGVKPIQSVKNNGNTVTFEPITYASATPNTFTYYVVEKNEGEDGVTYDKSVKKITVTLNKNASDGVISAAVAVDGGNSKTFTGMSDNNKITLDETGFENNKVYPVKIKKTDLGGNELEGAYIVLKDASGKIVDKWESTKEAHEVKLDPGKYTFKETVAPDDYQLIETTIEFVVASDGTVTVLTKNEDITNGGEVVSSGNVIALKDAPKKDVLIDKTDLGTGKELAGAHIVLTTKDGKTVEEWDSEADAPHALKLDPGTYIFKETVAPEGYQRVTTEIEFTVAEDGAVTTNNVKVDPAGEVEVVDNKIVLKDAPYEKPEIEKYVNKKNATEEERDGTVHTDLSAFDEVYTYDIQAYITNDAKYVEVTDTLKEVLEFAGDGPTAVKIKEGEDNFVAPKLSKPGTDVEKYTVDATAWKEGKLVLTMGSTAEDAKVLAEAGKWLQITFDAKIKKDYRSIEALKNAGVNVWETVTGNDPIDDADVVGEHSKPAVNSHEGIVNDAGYKIQRVAGVDVDNKWDYDDWSNKVTVQPKTMKIKAEKVYSTEDLPEVWPVVIEIESVDGTVKSQIELTEAKKSGESEELPVLKDGYKVNERTVPAGFSVNVTNDEEANSYVFTNTENKGKPVKVVFETSKSMSNRAELGTYTFELYDKQPGADVNPIQTVNNNGNTVTFEPITYASATKPASEYTYYVVEKNEGEDGVTYDESVKEITVKLSKDSSTDEISANVTCGSKTETFKGIDGENKFVLDSEGFKNKKVYPVEIDKTDLGSKEVAGAEIEIYDESGNKIDEWTSKEGETKKLQLDPGKYSFREVNAPEGFQAVTTTIEFEVAEDGTVKVLTTNEELDGEGKVVSNGTKITLQDAPKTDVRINKTDLGGEELDGAKIEIYDESGKKIDEWTSKAGETKDMKLDPGKYTFKEEVAPKGYQKVTTVVSFEVQKDQKGVKVESVETEPAGKVEQMNDGTIRLMDAPYEKPEIEKYVNKKDATPAERDGTVHTDLSAFDEVYTYDIQAYITNDASYVIVKDDLKEVLEFAVKDASNFEVFVKDAEADGSAPKLSTEGTKLTAGEYSLAKSDFEAGKLVVELGSEADDAAKLGDKFNSKWLQIKFDAKIKDDYKSIEALKKAGANVWETVTDNGLIDDPADVTVEHSGANPEEHEGVENDAEYTVRRAAGVSVDNTWENSSKSNHVTVQPKTTEITVEKTWTVGDSTEWPKGTTVTFGLYANGAKLLGTVDNNDSFTAAKSGDSKATQATVELTEGKANATITDLPCLEGVTYTAKEIKVTKDGKSADVTVDAEGVQTAIIDAFKYIVTIAEDAAKGEFKVNNRLQVRVKISKQDLGGTELTGAEMKIYEGDKAEGDAIDSWTSDADKVHEVFLDPGTYTMKEEVAPEGYAPVTTEMVFEVKADGTVELKTARVDNGGEFKVMEGDHIILADAPYRYISKTDLGGTELDGAEMKLTLPAGHPEGTELTWTSKAGEPLKFIAVDGDYKLEETVAPEGYQVVKTAVEFNVDKNGVVTVTKADQTTYGETTTVESLVSKDGKTVVLKDTPIPPQTEKYVNKDVDAELATFDEPFTYDIMAYVTKDGESLTITDTLVDALEFTETDKIAVADMGEGIDANNHLTTVAKDAEADITASAKITAKGQDLTVKIENAKPLRGHWIRVTFKAQIKAEEYAKVKAFIEEKAKKGKAADAADWNNINDNGLVLIKKDHDGVPNKAKYDLKTKNGGTFKETTNTVTVEPKTTEVEVEKSWTIDGVSGADWPKDTTVTFGIFAQKEDEELPDEPVETVDLTESKQSAKVENLPCITGVTYIAREIKVNGVDVKRVKEAGVVIVDGIDYIVKIVETATGFKAVNSTPESEKYVNKTVHAELATFDEEFTYDIMAYVPEGATKVELYDELKDQLTMVSTDEEIAASVVAKEENDHKVGGSVASEDGEKVEATAVIDGQKLTVTVDNIGTEEGQQNLEGKWVQATFKARISEKAYADIAKLLAGDADAKTAEELNWTKVTDNGPVQGYDEPEHTGLENKARYKVFVGNESSSDHETNTVTIEPTTTEVKVSKEWLTDDETSEWPAGATVEVILRAKGEGADKTGVDGRTATLSKDAPSAVFKDLPKVDTVTYSVEEGKVVNGGAYTFGQVEDLGDGVFKITNRKYTPEIEKYVNKKTDNLSDAERDGTVHTDLSAFDEVYTYDIQAYITPDAKYVEVIDELRKVLEFVGDGPTSVIVKDGAAKNAPKLTAAGDALENYTVDAEAWKAGKLVLTIGSNDKASKVLPEAGKWLQITFDARIKSQYKSIEALEAEGMTVWTKIAENDPIDDADVVAEHSNPAVDNHTGIVNDAYYNINKLVAGAYVDNLYQYSDKSNTVTVQPKSTEVSFSKKELGGEELPGAEMVLTDSEGNVIDTWTSTTEDHVLHLADGVYTMTEKVAPEGFYCVTTAMKFEVKDGKVTLLTAEVDNGGRLTLMEGNKIVLEDAPEVQEEYEPPKDDDEEEGSIVTPGGDESESTVKEAYEPEVRDVYVKEVADEETVRIVDTGDNAAVYIWALVFMISMCAVALAAIMRRRSAR